MLVDFREVITCFKFADDRFRGFALAVGQILPFTIDFDGRPYNTLTLPCERVINGVHRVHCSVLHALEIFLVMRYINVRFTYLLTYRVQSWVRGYSFCLPRTWRI